MFPKSCETFRTRLCVKEWAFGAPTAMKGSGAGTQRKSRSFRDRLSGLSSERPLARLALIAASPLDGTFAEEALHGSTDRFHRSRHRSLYLGRDRECDSELARRLQR